VRKTFDNDDVTTANHADASNSALQSAQLKAISIYRWCTASGAAATKQTSEWRHIKLLTNQQSTSKSTSHRKQCHWQQVVT